MSGETRMSESGWTTDTLHGLIVRLLEERDKRYGELFAALRAGDVERDRRYGAQFQGLLDQIIAADRRYDAQREGQEKAVNAALAAAEKAVNAALVAADRAVAKAEIAAEKRFDAVNEFRGQLKDQAATFLTRVESGVTINALKEQLDRVDKIVVGSMAKRQGEHNITAPMWAMAASVLTAVMAAAVVAWFSNSNDSKLEQRLLDQQVQAQQAQIRTNSERLAAPPAKRTP